MQYVVLLAAILILAGSVFLGYRKGFIRTALGMLALVLSLVIMQLIGPAVGNFLMEDSGLYEKTSRTIAESLKASVDLPETSDLSDIPADMVTPELEAQAEKQALEQTFLPEGDYLTILYAGTHQDSAAYYKRLLACAREQGLECSGDSAEITWIDSGFTDDQEKYVTELQIPVVSRTSGGYTESIGKDF